MSDLYIHGFSAREQERMALMQTILNRAELRELDLAGVGSMLDVGCGPGDLTRALQQAAGEGCRVLGIELEPRQLAEARRLAPIAGASGTLEFRQGSALSLPLRPEEVGAFDLAHARFLLEHVPDPERVVQEMVRAVRPGGRIVLIDDDHELLRLSPPCRPFADAWRTYWQSYYDRGLDPLVGRRLASLLIAAGARPVRSTVIFYGAVQGQALFGPVVENLIGVLTGAEAALLEAGCLAPGDLDQAIAAFCAWSALPDASLWYALPLVEGERRARRPATGRSHPEQLAPGGFERTATS